MAPESHFSGFEISVLLAVLENSVILSIFCVRFAEILVCFQLQILSFGIDFYRKCLQIFLFP